MGNEAEKQIKRLSEEVADINRRLQYLDSDNFRPESPESRRGEDASNTILSTEIADIVWDRFFYFSYITQITVSQGGGNIQFLSPTFSDQIIRHDRDTRFRTAFTMSTTETTADVYVTTLNDDASLGEKQSATGFRFYQGDIYGINQANGNESSVRIGEFVANTSYTVELRYFAGDRTDFYLNGSYAASLSTNLPVSTNEGNAVIDYIQIYAATGDAYVEYFEFLQDRDSD